MDQEFNYQPDMMNGYEEEMDQADKSQLEDEGMREVDETEFSQHGQIDGMESSKESNQQFMTEAYSNNMYYFPAESEYWMRADHAFRRPPAYHGHPGFHGGFGRPRPGYHGPFYGGGVPLHGGLASGLLFGSLFTPYGGYYPYYYQQPYYPYYPYY